MPYINIRVGTYLSESQKAQLFQQTTDSMNRIMGKRREVTVVQIEESSPENWSVNGAPLHVSVPSGAYVDVKITQGTNSDDEKAQLVLSLVRMLTDSIGAIQEAVYVVVHEISATSWGYNGRTQAARAAESKVI